MAKQKKNQTEGREVYGHGERGKFRELPGGIPSHVEENRNPYSREKDLTTPARGTKVTVFYDDRSVEDFGGDENVPGMPSLKKK